jgi:FAD/FMN-containing dehydrogenase
MQRPFTNAQIQTMWQHLNEPQYENQQALVQIDSYGGQINAVAPEATAVSHRSSILMLQYQTYWDEREDDQEHLAWIHRFYLEMYGATGPMPDETMDGCYVNYADVDLVNWQFLYYKHNYPRLQRTKACWDPLNIFWHAQSIELPLGTALSN